MTIPGAPQAPTRLRDSRVGALSPGGDQLPVAGGVDVPEPMWVQCPVIFGVDFFAADDELFEELFVDEEVVDVDASVKLTRVPMLRLDGVPALAAAWLTVVTR